MFAHPVIILSVFTLIAVLAIGFYQLRSVRGSQAKRGEVPGETTMTAHPSREAVRIDNRVATAGDVDSYKQQDADAANDVVRGQKPVQTPARLWGGTPRGAMIRS